MSNKTYGAPEATVVDHPTVSMNDGESDYESAKDLAWQYYRAAWNQKGSLDYMTDLEERTARQHFEEQWNADHGDT